MRKKFCICALVLTLVSLSSANAESIKATTSAKGSVDLREIVLNENQNCEIPEATYVAETSPPSSDVLSSETQSKNKPKDLLPLLNPISDAFKLNKAINGGVKQVDSNVDKEIEKFDKTPFKGIQKIDNTIDKGIESIDGAIGTTLEGLNEMTVEGAEAAKKILKTGIQKETVQQWIDGDLAAGRFFGARPIFESHGLTINSSFLYSPFMKTGGGNNGESSAKGYGLLNLGVSLDTEKAGLWKGGTFFALYQSKRGYGLSGSGNAMGDVFGFDGWDWRQANQISEYWYQQKLFNNKIRLKFGKQDANTDFGYLNSGWNFMNSAFSVIPTTPMPTYPDPAFGFMAELNPKEWLSIRDGIYSKFGVPFNITELEVKTKIKKLPGRYMLGAWEMSDSNGMSVTSGVDNIGNTYTNDFNRNMGAYFNFEQMLYKEKKDDNNDMQGLVFFGQFGISPSNKNDLSKYMGTGLQYIGLIPKRDKDIAGIAVGSGRFAPRLGDITSQVGSETAVECFYRAQITPWFYLQPDVQFIANPGGIYDNSVAIGLRSVITF